MRRMTGAALVSIFSSWSSNDSLASDLKVVEASLGCGVSWRQLRHLTGMDVEAEDPAIRSAKFLIRNLGTQCWFSSDMVGRSAGESRCVQSIPENVREPAWPPCAIGAAQDASPIFRLTVIRAI
jgi:hypothetical protein